MSRLVSRPRSRRGLKIWVVSRVVALLILAWTPSVARVSGETLDDFIRHFYQDAAGRTPATWEVAEHVQRLRALDDHQASLAVHDLLNMDEVRRRPFTFSGYVDHLYRAVLGRPADVEGERLFLGAVVDRHDAVLVQFVESAEFRARPLSAAAFVDRLYTESVGRRPTASEAAGWTLLAARGQEFRVAQGILGTEENQRIPRTTAQRVGLYFRAALGREGNEPEIAAWVNHLQSELRQIEAGFAFSPEFRDRLAALRGAPGPTDVLARLQPGEWHEVPDSQLRRVLPRPTPEGGAAGPSAVMGARSGGAYDARRDLLLIHGGGGADYPGNEVYAFSLSRLGWQLSLPPSYSYRLPGRGEPSYPDRTPAAAQTFGGLLYAPNVDRLLRLGGVTWGPHGTPTATSWSLDLDAKRWAAVDAPSRALPSPAAAFDPVTGLVWLHAAGELWTYDPVANRWREQAASAQDGAAEGMAAVVDPKRRLLVLVGMGQVLAYRLDGVRASPRESWLTTGDLDAVQTYAPGLDYDPVSEQIVAWTGGRDVFVLDADRREWTRTAGTGATPPQPAESGVWGRFRYVPSRKLFVAVTGIDDSVYLFKPPAADAVRPAPKAGAKPLGIALLQPAPGAAVRGVRSVAVNMTGVERRATVTLRVENTLVDRQDTHSSGRLLFSWDTRTEVDGPRTLTVRATDSSGRSASATVAVVVANTARPKPPLPTPSPPPASPPLTLAFTAPGAGATVSGTTSVSLTATGVGSGANTFTLMAGPDPVGTQVVTAPTATIAWNTQSVGNGATTLAASVTDGAGRTRTASIRVVVAKAPPAPGPPGRPSDLPGLPGNTWMRLAPTPTERTLCSGFVDCTRRRTLPNPAGRSYSGVVYGDGALFYFGGGHGSHPGNDVEIYDVGRNVWQQAYSPEGLPVACLTNVAADPACQIMNGSGTSTVTPLRRPYTEHQYQQNAYDPVRKTLIVGVGSGTWAFDRPTAQWTWLTPELPLSTDVHTKMMTWDPDLQAVLWFATTQWDRGVFAFDHGATRWVKRSSIPDEVSWGEIYSAFDVTHHRHLVSHDRTGLWWYDAAARTWSRVAGVPAGLGFVSSLAYDPVNRIFLLASNAGAPWTPLALWAFDGANRWERLTPQGAAPAVTHSGGAPWGSIVYDPINRVFFLVNPLSVGGGGTDDTAPDTVETWAYRYQRSTGTGDVSAPSVALSAPAPGGTVSRTITVTASATDDVGVIGVQVMVDGVNLGGALTAGPWTMAWDTTTVANGPHVLTAVARDRAGHVTTSAAVTVTVANNPPPGPPPAPSPGPGLPTTTLGNSGFGTLEQEKAYYRSRGWTWSPHQEPHGPPNPAPGYYVGEQEVHGDLEADDLWQNLMMWRRTGRPEYFEMARHWARYYRDEYPTSPELAADLSQFGGDHLFGWGLVDWWRITGDQKALDAAKAIGEAVALFDRYRDAQRCDFAGQEACDYFHYPAKYPAAHVGFRQWQRLYDSGSRQVGRHLRMVTELWSATGDATWKDLADRIVTILLTSPAWDARGAWLSFRDEGGGRTFATAVTPLHFAVTGDALWRYYELTSDSAVRRRLIAMANFAFTHGLAAGSQYTGRFIALDHRFPGQVYHELAVDPGGCFQAVTATFIDSLMRGWKLTGEARYRDRAYYTWDRASRCLTLDSRIPDVEFARFVNMEGSTGFLADSPLYRENGDLPYTWMLFSDVAVPQ